MEMQKPVLPPHCVMEKKPQMYRLLDGKGVVLLIC